MADVSHSQEPRWRFDRVWLFAAALPLVVAIFDPAQAVEMVRFALAALGHTGWFIAFAVLAVGYLKASGSEALLARAFEGREGRMIVMAALLGGLSPFCSCEVIPFIAALLAVGAPLSAVMAFWLASPLMDPAMFLITAGTLGLPFAVAKTMAAVGLGLLGGVTVYLFARSRVFADPLKIQSTKKGCCGSARSPFEGAPVWQFWTERPRREVFRDTVVDNALFLGKWLLLAYMIEALMLAYIPAETIATVLGGQGVWPVVLGALVGAPAYLNGYAAVPLVDALLAQGMANGAAMSFMLAGGVSCIPAAVAVWALVKPRVFAAYIGIAFAGSLMAGLAWGFAAG
ncbi:MAG: permease [Silicimonas sp.]|nr:permease [Silicimonas sp.]NNF92838.1 permease [Boseongicola sp.]RZW07984.1 MAG: permease [Paracoccaceae bacterium]